jgi:hypothetical protein
MDRTFLRGLKANDPVEAPSIQVAPKIVSNKAMKAKECWQF